jgi:hypothetical protein
MISYIDSLVVVVAATMSPCAVSFLCFFSIRLKNNPESISVAMGSSPQMGGRNAQVLRKG